MNWRTIVGLVAAAGCGVAAAQAQTKPVLWVDAAGTTVDAAATTHCDVIRMIEPGLFGWGLTIDRGMLTFQEQLDAARCDGRTTANACCDIISTDEPPRVALILKAFGAGGRLDDPGDSNSNYWLNATAIIKNPADRIDCSCATQPLYQQTPWPEHGKTEAAAWIRAFCKRYKERQAADPTIPSPEHIQIDLESIPHCGSISDTLEWAEFVACLMADDRSGANPLVQANWRYIPTGIGEWTTLAQSYLDAKRQFDGVTGETTLPTDAGLPDPMEIVASGTYEQKTLFASWINSTYRNATADAIDVSVQRVVDKYFPDCTVGNFNFIVADGKIGTTTPLQLPYVYNSFFYPGRLFGGDSGSPILGTSGQRLAYDATYGWNNPSYANFLDVECPVFYGIHPRTEWVSSSESPSSYEAKFMTYMAQQLDVVNFSEDETRRYRVIPWIAGKDQYEQPLWMNRTVDYNFFRDIFATGRAKGVKDYLLFEPVDNMDSTEKLSYDEAMGDVIQPEIVCVEAGYGGLPLTGDFPALLRESDGKTLACTSWALGGGQSANFLVKIRVPSGFNPDKLKIVAEAHAVFDNVTPISPNEIISRVRPWSVTLSSYYHADHAGRHVDTPVPQPMSAVTSAASNFLVSGTTCGGSGNEIWLFVQAQTESGAHVTEPFTFYVDNVMVYGYE